MVEDADVTDVGEEVVVEADEEEVLRVRVVIPIQSEKDHSRTNIKPVAATTIEREDMTKKWQEPVLVCFRRHNAVACSP